MTMTMVAGLALLLLIVGLITAARLLAKTRRLEREIASQRTQLGEMLRENLDLRFPGQSQAGPRAGSLPPR